MDLIPHDEIRPSHNFNFAPMIDFLFIMLALFATLAISKATLYDTEVNLVQIETEGKSSPLSHQQETFQINLSINSSGKYKWLTEFQEYPMENTQQIQEELAKQYQIGILPQDKVQTEVLLHIDKRAPWESVANLFFAVKELGFTPHPVHQEP